MAAIGPETALLLLAASLLAGALNAIAGGATFFTFPVLVWSGLPPLIANTTNMVALVPANLAALPAYRRQLTEVGSRIWGLLAMGTVGGLIGAVLLLSLGGDLFAAAVPYLMGFATVLFAAAPAIRRRVLLSGSAAGRGAPLLVLFVFSIYGGYFGAGLGQLLLAALILAGYEDFHRSNALKNAVAGAICLTAVIVYGFSAAVSWPHAAIMIIGTTLGGFLGGALSQLVPQTILRAGVIILGAALTVYYFAG